MASYVWGAELAAAYDAGSREMFDPALLDPCVDALAGDGPALEFAVGTGRVALPLGTRGVPVCGIELSPHMAGQLRAKPGADAVPVTVGDMTATRMDDLMARLAALRLDHRWAGWDRSPFTAESASQVAVYRKQHDV